jgi:hypothetical protein
MSAKKRKMAHGCKYCDRREDDACSLKGDVHNGPKRWESCLIRIADIPQRPVGLAVKTPTELIAESIGARSGRF